MLESKRFPPSNENSGNTCLWWARHYPPAPVCGYPKAEIEAIGYSGCSGKIDPKTCAILNKKLYGAVIRDNYERLMTYDSSKTTQKPNLRLVE